MQSRVSWPRHYLTPPGIGYPRLVLHRRPQRALGWEILETLILGLMVFLIVRSVFLNFQVDGQSMAPTLRDGQYLLVNRLAYIDLERDVLWQFWPDRASVGSGARYPPLRAPQRGEVVVFWPPSVSDRPFIKRVIGLPGETVEVREGAVLIDGVALDEPYLRARPVYSSPPARVPPGKYYVLGDNRNNSSDSHIFGMLPAEHIIGQALFSYWPVDAAGLIAPPTYAAPSPAP